MAKFVGKEDLEGLGFDNVQTMDGPAVIINGRPVACRSMRFASLSAVKKFFKDSELIIIYDPCVGEGAIGEDEDVYIRVFPVCNYGTVELTHDEVDLVMSQRTTVAPGGSIAVDRRGLE